jgi:hypothetical protein
VAVEEATCVNFVVGAGGGFVPPRIANAEIEAAITHAKAEKRAMSFI